MKVYAISLGCPKNRTDTEKLLARLKERGAEPVLSPEEADLLLVNTCAFIRPAVRESIETILELAEQKRPGQKLAITGCLVARYGEEVARRFPEADLVCGIEAFRQPEIFEQDKTRLWLKPEGPDGVSRILTESPFYAYLKLTEGCSHGCSFCTIPRIRGPLRSRSEREILREALELVSQGVREIILVGQDISSYGKDRGRAHLPLLLRNLLRELPDGVRLRLLYLHPRGLTPELLEVLGSEPRLAPYVDLPLQHAHPEILRRMGRFYRPERVLELLEELRRLRPEIGLRTTVMVGFPGEGEEEFRTLLEFLKQARFDHLGVFVFYPEEGTPAAGFKPRVPWTEARRRRHRVLALQQEISRENLRRRVGGEDLVLVTGYDDRGRPVGHAGFQAPEVDGRTIIRKGLPVSPGEMVRVRFTRSFTYDLWAEALEGEEALCESGDFGRKEV